jgi:hypothetical protein
MANRLRPSANSLLYVYGITQAPGTLPATLRGVDGISAIQAHECEGFVCWISRVDATEFGEQLSQNMENLEWLADAGVRHQRVVGAIHEKQQILPARFGTVFINEDSLDADLVRRKPALTASFRRIDDADEWGIRVFALPKTSSTVTARTGKEYLQRKSTLLKSKPSRTLEPEIKEFGTAVANLATASAEGGKVGSGQPGLRWQTSVLLPRARRGKFESLLARFARKWHDRFRLECTGPWPPYSFVADEAQARPEARPPQEPQKRRSRGVRGVAR